MVIFHWKQCSMPVHSLDFQRCASLSSLEEVLSWLVWCHASHDGITSIAWTWCWPIKWVPQPNVHSVEVLTFYCRPPPKNHVDCHVIHGIRTSQVISILLPMCYNCRCWGVIVRQSESCQPSWFWAVDLPPTLSWKSTPTIPSDTRLAPPFTSHRIANHTHMVWRGCQSRDAAVRWWGGVDRRLKSTLCQNLPKFCLSLTGDQAPQVLIAAPIVNNH